MQSLRRRYTADLSSKQMAVSVSSQLADGLSKTDQSALPGKFKVWCYQFILYYRLMWPLKLSDITSTTIQRMDSKAKNYIRKWLGLPHCHSDTALIDNNILKLPLKSISLGCKKAKLRHMFELRDSSHPYKTPRPKSIQDASGRELDNLGSSNQQVQYIGCLRLHTTPFPVPGTFTSGTAQRRPVNSAKCRSQTCSTSSPAVRQCWYRADTDGITTEYCVS